MSWQAALEARLSSIEQSLIDLDNNGKTINDFTEESAYKSGMYVAIYDPTRPTNDPYVKFPWSSQTQDLSSYVTDIELASFNFASTSYVDAALASLVDSSPAALDTLNELANALGNDPNFATTVTNTLSQKADLNSENHFTQTQTIIANNDFKLRLEVDPSQDDDWNYIEFYGSDGVRDAYIGTDSLGQIGIVNTNNNAYFSITNAGVSAISGQTDVSLRIAGNHRVGLTDSQLTSTVAFRADAGFTAYATSDDHTSNAGVLRNNSGASLFSVRADGRIDASGVSNWTGLASFNGGVWSNATITLSNNVSTTSTLLRDIEFRNENESGGDKRAIILRGSSYGGSSGSLGGQLTMFLRNNNADSFSSYSFRPDSFIVPGVITASSGINALGNTSLSSGSASIDTLTLTGSGGNYDIRAIGNQGKDYFRVREIGSTDPATVELLSNGVVGITLIGDGSATYKGTVTSTKFALDLAGGSIAPELYRNSASGGLIINTVNSVGSSADLVSIRNNGSAKLLVKGSGDVSVVDGIFDVYKTGIDTSSNVWSTLNAKMKGNPVNTLGGTAIGLATSAAENYGISLLGARKGTDGTPTFAIRGHFNSDAGEEWLTLDSKELKAGVRIVSSYTENHSSNASFHVERTLGSTLSNSPRGFRDSTVFDGNNNTLGYAGFDSSQTLSNGTFDHITSFQSRPGLNNVTITDFEAFATSTWSFANSNVTNYVGLLVGTPPSMTNSTITNFYGLKINGTINATNKWVFHSEDSNVKALMNGELTVGGLVVDGVNANSFARHNSAQAYTSQQYFTVYNGGTGSQVDWDLNNQEQRYTITSNSITIPNPTNLQSGTYVLYLTSTTTRASVSISWGSNFEGTSKPATISLAANEEVMLIFKGVPNTSKVRIISFIQDGFNYNPAQ